MRKRKQKLKKKQDKPPIVGETINLASYRRLQVNDTRPADLKGVIEKEKAIAKYEAPKEHDWMSIGVMIFIVLIGAIIFLTVLPKIDLGGLFDGGGGGDSPPITALMLLGLCVRGKHY